MVGMEQSSFLCTFTADIQLISCLHLWKSLFHQICMKTGESKCVFVFIDIWNKWEHTRERDEWRPPVFPPAHTTDLSTTLPSLAASVDTELKTRLLRSSWNALAFKALCQTYRCSVETKTRWEELNFSFIYKVPHDWWLHRWRGMWGLWCSVSITGHSACSTGEKWSLCCLASGCAPNERKEEIRKKIIDPNLKYGHVKELLRAVSKSFLDIRRYRIHSRKMVETGKCVNLNEDWLNKCKFTNSH